MEFSHKFEVEAKIDDVWAVMNDVERIAPCLPGTQLKEIDGDEYHGIIKVKVGPIGAQYKGVAKFESIDSQARKIVLAASGRDIKGSGNARANIAVALQEGSSQDFTEVEVEIQLNISGKVAQFGRGVLTDVNAKLMEKFAQNLSEMITSGATAAQDEAASDGAVQHDSAAGDGVSESAASDEGVGADAPVSDTAPESLGRETPAPERKIIDSPEPEPVDLIATTSSGKIKAAKVAVIGFFAVVGLWLLRKLRRRKSKSKP